MADQSFTAGQILTASQMSALQSNIGLVPITPTSVTNGTLSGNVASITSGSASVTINGCFTTNFTNYKVIITNFVCSAAPAIYLKFNNSTGSTYSSLLSYYSYGSPTGANSPSAASAAGMQLFLGATSLCTAEFEVFAPFVTSRTTMRSSGQSPDNPGTSLGIDTNSASQTAFSLSTSTGTITSGSITVYGYR